MKSLFSFEVLANESKRKKIWQVESVIFQAIRGNVMHSQLSMELELSLMLHLLICAHIA